MQDEMNKNVGEVRKAEEDAYQKAMGRDVSFEEYLKKENMSGLWRIGDGGRRGSELQIGVLIKKTPIGVCM